MHATLRRLSAAKLRFNVLIHKHARSLHCVVTSLLGCAAQLLEEGGTCDHNLFVEIEWSGVVSVR